MNYMKQLNEFYSTLDYKPLSASAVAIYIILLHIANKTGWIDEFKVANSILMSKCNLSLSTVQRSRNELIVQGYILYKKGLNQNDAPKYKIKKLYFEQADEQACEQPTDQANEQAGDHINKQNNTKHKKKNIKKEFVAPSLEEVEEYVRKNNLNMDAEYFYKYYTAGQWKDVTGKKIKNWKQKAITWSTRNKVKEVTEDKLELVEMDTSGITDEEYVKFVKGEKHV